MNQDMKVYPKPTKDIYCLDCKELITNREDLFVVYKDSTNLPIHVDCYNQLLEMELIKNSPVNTSLKDNFKKLKEKPLIVVILTSIFLFLGGVTVYIAWRQIELAIKYDLSIWVNLIPLFIVLGGIPVGVLVLVWIRKSIWRRFDSHLPATCQ